MLKIHFFFNFPFNIHMHFTNFILHKDCNTERERNTFSIVRKEPKRSRNYVEIMSSQSPFKDSSAHAGLQGLGDKKMTYF